MPRKKLVTMALILILLPVIFSISSKSQRDEQSDGFSGTKPYQMWQGVATDGEYIYVSTDRNEQFELENIISQFTMDGLFIREKRMAYTGRDSLNRFMSFGDLTVIEGYLFIPVYNWNGGAAETPMSRESRILKYRLPDLEMAAEYPIGDGTAESVAKHNNHFWVVYHDKQEVREINEYFQWLKSYPLSQSIYINNTENGPQGMYGDGNDLYINNHGANDYGMFYAPGLDKYRFEGDTFRFIERIKPPAYGAGQGIEKWGGSIYWADRPGNRIIRTAKM